MKNIALIGLGRFGLNYLLLLEKIYKDTGAIIKCCSRNIDSYTDCLKKTNIQNSVWESDYKKICADPNIDGVIVCTPPESHYEIVKLALENKKHVLCEKPFVFKEKQAEELAKLAKMNGRILIINYIHLWNSFYQKVCKFHNEKNIVDITFWVTNPKTNREHHSLIWDWLPHETAMISHLFPNENFEVKGIANKSIKECDLATVYLTNQSRRIKILINTNADKKSRQISAIAQDGSTFMAKDLFEGKPLDSVVFDFYMGLEGSAHISNSGVAIESTRLLNKIEEKIVYA